MKYGFGICEHCKRAICATKKGFAYRHGPFKHKCPGSSEILKNWTPTERWKQREFKL